MRGKTAKLLRRAAAGDTVGLPARVTRARYRALKRIAKRRAQPPAKPLPAPHGPNPEKRGAVISANRRRMFPDVLDATPPLHWWLRRPGIDAVRLDSGDIIDRPRAVGPSNPPPPARVMTADVPDKAADLTAFTNRLRAAGERLARQAERAAAHEAIRDKHRAAALAGGGARERARRSAP